MAEALQPGDVFAGHRIEAVAGRGGMGVVYRATHMALDHVVALKVISPALAQDERFRRRFGEESRIAVSIRHPNVVQIHHAGEEDGLLFVTMDLIEGTDLRGLLREQARLDPAHAASIVAEVASALDAAHARGLVHRDIKPGNVLIEGEGADERVYLTDFGLARQVEATTGLTATGAFVGTLDYVAPEQIRGERVDARADVYALGCVLFELLTGIPPFASREDKVAKMYAHLQEEPTSVRVLRPELPGEVELVIERTLAKDPAERYPSAGDLARSVGAALEGQPTKVTERSVGIGAAAPGPPEATTTAEAERRGEPSLEPAPPAEDPTGSGPTVAQPPPRRPPRRGLLIGLGVAGAAAVAIVAIVLVSGGDGESGAGDDGEFGDATVAQKLVPVGRLPINLTHGQEGIWVTNRLSDSVSLVDGDPAEEVDAFPAGSAPEGVAVGDGSVWVSSSADDELLRLAPSGGAIEDRIPVGETPGGVAFGAGSVWVANNGESSVSRVDPESGSVRPIAVGPNPYGVAIGDDAVWVSNRGGDSISRINPINGRVDEPIAVGDNPKGIAFGAGATWVANADDGTVSQVVGGSERAAIEVGPEPRGVASGFGSIWASVGGADEVARIDPETAEVVQRIPVGSGPEGITAGPKSVWVADGIDGALTRIAP